VITIELEAAPGLLQLPKAGLQPLLHYSGLEPHHPATARIGLMLEQ
jgi:hypothetical protein